MHLSGHTHLDPSFKVQGTAKSSIVSKLMENLSREDEKAAQEDVEHFKDVVGLAYVGRRVRISLNWADDTLHIPAQLRSIRCVSRSSLVYRD